MSKELEYKELIETSIQKNTHLQGNEDLFDDFYSESFNRLKKSMTLLGDKLPPNSYIEKVTATAILKILKDTNRLHRKKESEKSLPILGLISYNINEYGEIAFNIPYPNSERENSSIVLKQLKTLIGNLEKLNANEPEKHFTRFFELKFEKNLKIPEIALELEISEESAAQRYFELVAKLNSYY